VRTGTSKAHERVARRSHRASDTERHANRGPVRRRRGFTLFEIMVALALVAVLFSVMGMAIDLYLRTAQAGRAEVETAVLARNLLDLMARELRGTLRVAREQRGVAGAGADDETAAAGTGNATGPPDHGDGHRDTGTSRGTNNAASSGESLRASDPRPVAGLRGTSEAVEFDLAWLPRPEQMARPASTDPTAMVVRPMALQTIEYSVEAVSDPFFDAADARPSRPPGDTVGLVRRQWDRIALLSAAESGGGVGNDGQTRLLAAEVRQIEFRYWDGVAWTGVWDSARQDGLPGAIEVAIVLSQGTGEPDAGPVPIGAASLFERADQAGDTIYRRVIDLPTAWQTPTATGGIEETAP